MESTVGGLAEALFSRIIIEKLKSTGYTIKSLESLARNYRINDEDIDLLVIADKDGVEEHSSS
ncbi:MAG: hypothetical protein GSR75_02080 [Desulfurococcales archaeon]|nr:hypothetical protein [Desulfurococcales archaeon]